MTDCIMSKKEAVYWHRKMWNWIAQTSIQEERCVSKNEALEHFGFHYKPMAHCFCCEYAYRSIERGCDKCPIVWENVWCGARSSFWKWKAAFYDQNYIFAAKWAYIIAELPERKDQSYDF